MASVRALDERDTRAPRATTYDSPNDGWTHPTRQFCSMSCMSQTARDQGSERLAQVVCIGKVIPGSFTVARQAYTLRSTPHPYTVL